VVDSVLVCKEFLAVVRDTGWLGQLGQVVGWVGKVLGLGTGDSIEHLGNDNCLVILLPLGLLGYRPSSQRHDV